jgi:hypothetical protein
MYRNPIYVVCCGGVCKKKGGVTWQDFSIVNFVRVQGAGDATESAGNTKSGRLSG